MGIVTVGVVDGSIGAHSIGHKLLPDKVLQQFDLLLTVQLDGQGNDKLTGKPAVLGCLDFLHGVPELFPISAIPAGHIPAETLSCQTSPCFFV